MPHAAYPTAADLQAFLRGLSTPLPAGLDLAALEEKVADAVAEWEERTGWRPYLAPSAPVTLLYDPPSPTAGAAFATGWRGGRILELKTGLLSLTSLTVTDTAYTLGQDFWLRPNNAAPRGLPYTEIEFLGPVFGLPQSVAVGGVFGCVAQLPDTTWRRIIERAASLSVPELSVAISGGVAQVRTENTLVQFAGSGVPGPLAREQAAWDAAFDRAVTRAKRITL
jgi:hypothetical protein